MLSESEKYRLAGAVAFALAEVGKVGFVWLDRFETLLKANKRALIVALSDTKFPVNTVFLNLSTDEVPASLPDWMQHIKL